MNKNLKLALAAATAATLPTACTTNPYFGKYLSDCTEEFPEPVHAPEGAPNVLWIMFDDVGYAASSAFGGLIETPTLDSLAQLGMCYTNFHTAGISAPSRAALLTGRNHHRVHMGNFAHQMRRAGFPGYDGLIPSECGTVAEILRDNGYNTFAVGKYGLTPDYEASDAGPFDHWPQGKGFEHFYGIIASSTDNYNPQLVDELVYQKPDGTEFGELITTRAIEYIDRQKAAAPDKPFFFYYAPHATHTPIQVPSKWIKKYEGKFDEGWDVFREKVFERQKAMGVVPANAVLPPRESHLQEWATLPAEERRLYARFMEAYAGYFSYADYQLNRLLAHLRDMGQLENTIIFTIIGDNGAEKKGTLHGELIANPYAAKAMDYESKEEQLKFLLDHYDYIGTPKGTMCGVPLGWSQALNTPYQNWKGFADSEGATRNPLIINYGDKIKHGIREQFCFLTDILPTTLEMLGIEAPKKIRGIKQEPLQGKSLVYTFDDPDAPERHTEQYFFIYSSRAFYKDGWKISKQFPQNLFGDEEKGLTDEDYEWKLFNLRKDPTEIHDLAAENPALVRKLVRRFEKISSENNIWPYYRRSDINNQDREINHMTKEQKAYYRRLFGGPSKYKDVEPKYE